MNEKSITSRFWLVMVASSALVFFIACGGSRDSSYGDESAGEVDIDELLGSEEQNANQPSDDDEVLRLLGILPDSSDEQQTDETATAVDNEPGMAESEFAAPSEVDQLRDELEKKSEEISTLQANISQKEMKIQQLQRELENAQKMRTRSKGNGLSIPGISADYAQRYARARDLYEQRKYRQAIEVFSQLLAENSNNKLADNSQYWIGECYYGLGNYQQSIAEFQKVFAFTLSDKSDDVLLKLGLCYLKLGDREQARSEFEQLLANYPKSEYVGKARLYLSKL